MFAVKLDAATGKITLTEVTDHIVNQGQGVVLKQTTESSNATATVVMLPTTSSSTFDYSGNNSLTGTMTSITNPGNAYVLNYKEATGVGFYKLSDTGTIGAQKAYLTYTGTGTAPEFFSFDVANVTTGMCDVRSKMADVRSEVYNLNGQRVAQPQKGLYIVNGKKVIIK